MFHRVIEDTGGPLHPLPHPPKARNALVTPLVLGVSGAAVTAYRHAMICLLVCPLLHKNSLISMCYESVLKYNVNLKYEKNKLKTEKHKKPVK